MPVIFEAVPFGSPGRKRKHRIEAIQSLNRGLLIHAKHGRVLRRLQIQPDDIGCFGLEIRVVARHVALQPMRLQPRLPTECDAHWVCLHPYQRPACESTSGCCRPWASAAPSGTLSLAR